MKTSRRKFIQGCCSGIAAMSGVSLHSLAFGSDPNRDILVTIFLRGGMDALSFLAPWSDANYHTNRVRLGLDSVDVHQLTCPVNSNFFGLNKNATKLRDIYDAGQLAFVPASGVPDGSRSHFDAQDMVDRGIVGDSARFGSGWLARHILTSPDITNSVFRSVSMGTSVATSLEGFGGALALSNVQGFKVDGEWNQVDQAREAIRDMYSVNPVLKGVVERTLDACDVVAASPISDYVPPGGVVYANNSFANTLKGLAQIIRLDLGLEAATVDLGGWDTHESQADNSNPSTGYFAGKIVEMSDALSAFWSDMSDKNVVVTVVSEFGRRLKENANTGTDHGHGGIMMVFSKNLTSKRIWGQWPGLTTDELFERVDLAVTTDYRTVLWEILNRRRGATNLAEVFPGYTFPGALGLFGPPGALNKADVADWSLF